jgi:hypothetical protein
MREPPAQVSSAARAPSTAETPLYTMPYFVGFSPQGVRGLLFGILAFVPLCSLWIISLVVWGALVSIPVGLVALLVVGLVVRGSARTPMDPGRFSFYADRIEWNGPTVPGFTTTPSHQVLAYADVGHMERAHEVIILRGGPSNASRLYICVDPGHLEPLWKELLRQVTQARPEGAIVSVRPSTEQPPRYLPEGTEPLTYLSHERTVTGRFRIESRELIWRVYAEGATQPLVRLRRQDQSRQHEPDTDDAHWYVETPGGDLLAHLWVLQGAATRLYDVRGFRGEELGRLKVRRGFTQGEAQLTTGTHQMTLVRNGDGVRIEHNGKHVAHVGGAGTPNENQGQVDGELPYLTFSLAVAAGVLVTQ